MNKFDTSNATELAITGLKPIIQDKMKVREDTQIQSWDQRL